MQAFRKRPVEIRAIQWDGTNLFDVVSFMSGPPELKGIGQDKWEQYTDLVRLSGLKIKTLEGEMSASVGDWVIRGIKGEFYPCKPDIFAETYESAEVQPAMARVALPLGCVVHINGIPLRLAADSIGCTHPDNISLLGLAQ